MIKGFLLFFYTTTLFCGTVINQNIYEKEESVDIMLSFDTPYEGKIIQKQDKDAKIFILNDTTIAQKVERDIDSDIIQKLQIIPYKKQLLIQLSAKGAFEVDASKTVDLYGLRLRVTPKIVQDEMDNLVIPKEEKQIETKKEEPVSTAYLKVMALLFALVALLYLLKKWLEKKGDVLQGGWLFDKNKTKQNGTIKVQHQRTIDVKNRVVLISYKNKEYLLLLGNNNLLLDTFTDQERDPQNDFDDVLSQNKEALNDFINSKSSTLERYKEKISTEFNQNSHSL